MKVKLKDPSSIFQDTESGTTIQGDKVYEVPSNATIAAAVRGGALIKCDDDAEVTGESGNAKPDTNVKEEVIEEEGKKEEAIQDENKEANEGDNGSDKGNTEENTPAAAMAPKAEEPKKEEPKDKKTTPKK